MLSVSASRAALSAANVSRVLSSLLVLVLLSVSIAVPGAAAQGGGMAPLAGGGGGSSYGVQVTPEWYSRDRAANMLDAVDRFDVKNTGSSNAEFEVTCSRTGTVLNCSPDVFGFVLSAGATRAVYVTHDLGAAGAGTLRLTAVNLMGEDVDHHATITVSAIAAPSVVLEVPVGTGRAVVRNRQPILRALLRADDDTALDTTMTVLTWRGDTVTALTRHNRGLLEWEVDSLHWLRTGLPGFSGTDSAEAKVRVCDALGGCTTVSRWVVLPNDQAPVLGFTGMPFGTVNGGFSSGFGPGLGVSGAEVTTGFATPGYVSMGQGRSAGLVYSTRQSYPRALVQVDLDLPWPAGTPSQVKLVLSEGTLKLDSLVLASPASSCLTGSVRRCRATLQAEFTGVNPASVMRKWLTVSASVTSGGVTKTSADSVEVVVVDRRDSPYGSGWWPSALSQLVDVGNDRVLVGATGGAVIYRGHGDSVYLPPPGNFVALRTVGTGHELQGRGAVGKSVFDATGRLSLGVDASGNADTLKYDAATLRITEQVDPIGKKFTFAYTSGRLSIITDPAGRQNTVTINATTNQLTRRHLASPVGRPDTVGYGYRTYPGTKTVVLRRRHGVLLGDSTVVVYDSLFRRRPKEVRLPRVPNETGTLVTPVIQYTAYERQGVGALRSLDSVYVEMKDPLGHWTRSLLNRWGQSRRSWDQLGLLARAAYDPDGFVLWAEGKNGDSSRVYTAYDAARRPAKTWIERGATTGSHVLRLDSLVYDANHRVVKTIDSRGYAAETWYDVKGRPTRTCHPVTASTSQCTEQWYNTRGQVDSVEQEGTQFAEGPLTRYAYDAVWKNPYQVRDRASTVLSATSFDNLGRGISVENKQQVGLDGETQLWQWSRTETFFDAGGRADSVRTMLTLPGTYSWPQASDTVRTQRVSHRYDAAGRDTARVNNRGKRTSYTYDLLGRLIRRRPWADSLAVRDSMAYDIGGNLRKTFTRRGHVITHAYDSRNRDTLTVIPGVGDLRRAFGGPQDQVTRLWLANGVDSIGGVNGEVRSSFDGRGRLRADTVYTGGTPRVTTYAYDTWERPATTTDPLGTWTLRYETVRGNADTLVTPMLDTLVYFVDKLGRLEGRNVSHDDTLRMQSSVLYKWNLTEGASATVVNGAAGSYLAGSFGRAIGDTSTLALTPSWTEELGVGAARDTLRDSTAYDNWGRLTRWAPMRGTSPDGPGESYTYDRGGNLRVAGETVVIDPTTERLTSRTVGGVTTTYTYDRAGNLITRSSSGVTWTFGYDPLDRLVSVRRGATLITRYGYDVLGRRIAKRVYSSVSGGTVGYTRFVYKGSHVSFETDSVGTIGMRYTWGAGTDDLVAITTAAGAHYYVTTDKLGSVRSIAKRDGTWQLSQRFDPYGRIVARDTAATYTLGAKLRYRWTGREYDAETGFSYHRARYFDAESRRWTQEDPIGYAGGMNVYAYVGGSPLEATDPSGLESSLDPTFTPFCTWGGSCVDAVGNVTRQGWQFAVDGVMVGGGGSGWAARVFAATVSSVSGVAAQSSFGNLANAIWGEQVTGLRTSDSRWNEAVRDCRAASTSCDYMVQEIINRRVVVYGYVQEGSSAGTGKRDGRTRFTARDGSAVIHIDPSTFSATTMAYVARGIYAPMTMVTVVGHELGHVYGQMEIYRRGDAGWCEEACARHFENMVRMDTRLGHRPDYGP